MQKKSFEHMQCPIARSLERVGEWWSILILRDAFYGLHRFDEFEKSLGIAPNMLARRLNSLVEMGLLEKRQYSQRPLRYEYHLTECSRDFRPILLSLLAWGNKYFAPEGKSVVIKNKTSGEEAELILTDAKTGEPLSNGSFVLDAGPAANEGVRNKIEKAEQLRASKEALL